MEPDIVTAGKALNNGHPISFLFTSHKILSSLGGQSLLDVVSLTIFKEILKLHTTYNYRNDRYFY